MEKDKLFETMEKVLDNPPKTEKPKEEKFDKPIIFLDKDATEEEVDEYLKTDD